MALKMAERGLFSAPNLAVGESRRTGGWKDTRLPRRPSAARSGGTSTSASCHHRVPGSVPASGDLTGCGLSAGLRPAAVPGRCLRRGSQNSGEHCSER